MSPLRSLLVFALGAALAAAQPQQAPLAKTSGQDGPGAADQPSPGRIAQLLLAHPDKFGAILKAPHEFRAQVLLGEIAEGPDGPRLVEHGWRVDDEYFYPASTVKLVAAAVALERLNEIRATQAPEADERTPLAFQPLFKDEKLEDTDATNVDGGVITLEHLIRKALIVSDNPAYNRLYDFCGQQWLNERAWRAGLTRTKLSHRLSVQRSQVDNKRTCAVELRLPESPVTVDARWSNVGALEVIGPKQVFVGTAHRTRGGLVTNPMSFFHKNYLPLRDLMVGVARITRPDLELAGEPFDLTDDQRALLMDAMSIYPGDSRNPVYERAQHPDDYVKFFLPGLARVLPKERLRIYNKVGLAYGFVTDGAYIVDTKTNRGFFLAATIYANSDGVLNDDQYDYETVAFPFFADLAEVIARDVWGVPAAEKKQ